MMTPDRRGTAVSDMVLQDMGDAIKDAVWESLALYVMDCAHVINESMAALRLQRLANCKACFGTFDPGVSQEVMKLEFDSEAWLAWQPSFALQQRVAKLRTEDMAERSELEARLKGEW